MQFSQKDCITMGDVERAALKTFFLHVYRKKIAVRMSGTKVMVTGLNRMFDFSAAEFDSQHQRDHPQQQQPPGVAQPVPPPPPPRR